MSAIDKVLERLQAVKPAGSGKWMARCPAHEDRSPSLSIREKDDGRVLIKCFSGCGAGDVLDAIGLRMADLFDKPIAHHLPPIRGGFSARELLELINHEATVVAIIATDIESRPLTAEDSHRLRQASARIGQALGYANGC